MNQNKSKKSEHLKISLKAKDLLYSLKKRGETYSQLIERICEYYREKTAGLCPNCLSDQIVETEVTSTAGKKVKKHQVNECLDCECIWPPLMLRSYKQDLGGE